jgi:hypothetical protein
MLVDVQNWATWAPFASGVSISVTAAYLLGRMDARRRFRKVRDTWVLVEDLDFFGLAMLDQMRSKTKAEQARRRWANSGRSIEVMAYSEWLERTTTHVHNIRNWEHVKRILSQIEKVNALWDETTPTLLPVDVKPGLNFETETVLNGLAEISLQIADLAHRIDSAEKLFVQHTEKVGHVTAEMRAITEDEGSSSPFTRPFKLSGQAGRPLIRSTRGLVGIGGMEKHRENPMPQSKYKEELPMDSGNEGNEEGN